MVTWKWCKRIWSVAFTLALVGFVVWLPWLNTGPQIVSKVIASSNLILWAVGVGGAVMKECWKG